MYHSHGSVAQSALISNSLLSGYWHFRAFKELVPAASIIQLPGGLWCLIVVWDANELIVILVTRPCLAFRLLDNIDFYNISENNIALITIIESILKLAWLRFHINNLWVNQLSMILSLCHRSQLDISGSRVLIFVGEIKRVIGSGTIVKIFNLLRKHISSSLKIEPIKRSGKIWTWKIHRFR